MKESDLDAFISCSARSNDKEVNNFFVNLIDKARIHSTVSLDNPDLKPSPEKIRDQINKCDIFISIATARYEVITPGRYWKTSEWIHEELGIAYALRKPIVIIYESSVALDEGISKRIVDCVEFDRTKLNESEPKFKQVLAKAKQQYRELNKPQVPRDIRIANENIDLSLDFLKQSGVVGTNIELENNGFEPLPGFRHEINVQPFPDLSEIKAFELKQGKRGDDLSIEELERNQAGLLFFIRFPYPMKRYSYRYERPTAFKPKDKGNNIYEDSFGFELLYPVAKFTCLLNIANIKRIRNIEFVERQSNNQVGSCRLFQGNRVKAEARDLGAAFYTLRWEFEH
jgi:hypothetical protein